MINLRYVTDDDWNNPLYENENTGVLYVEVDGLIHYRSGEYGEPIQPVGFKYEITHPKPENPQKHIYMMLDMMRSKVEYFLNYGKGNLNQLHGGSVTKHIRKMKCLWNSLNEKPEWLTMKQINKYHKRMKEYKRAEVQNT
jgi:hypothetical protein